MHRRKLCFTHRDLAEFAFLLPIYIDMLTIFIYKSALLFFLMSQKPVCWKSNKPNKQFIMGMIKSSLKIKGILPNDFSWS